MIFAARERRAAISLARLALDKQAASTLGACMRSQQDDLPRAVCLQRHRFPPRRSPAFARPLTAKVSDGERETNVGTLCTGLGIARQTPYRHVLPGHLPDDSSTALDPGTSDDSEAPIDKNWRVGVGRLTLQFVIGYLRGLVCQRRYGFALWRH
jgi:hypothetical protein